MMKKVIDASEDALKGNLDESRRIFHHIKDALDLGEILPACDQIFLMVVAS